MICWGQHHFLVVSNKDVPEAEISFGRASQQGALCEQWTECNVREAVTMNGDKS